MRTTTAVSNLRVGMIAFLPYWGRLLKSKITKVSGPYEMKTGPHVGVFYVSLAKTTLQCENMCMMKSSSVYEVYSRKPRRNSRTYEEKVNES